MKKTSKILRRILSFVIISIMLLGMLPPAQVKAGHTCPICEEWIDDGEYCILCYCCDDCTSYWCEECGLCTQCVEEEGVHCSDCGQTCFFNADESEYCQVCNKCDSCVTMMDSGYICEDCFQENADPDSICPKCESVIIKGLDDEPLDACAECENHCQDCYDAYVCPECDECTLCEEVELCEICGYCENCWYDYALHCPDCGQCYDDVSPCWEGGDHCEDCCEELYALCDNCGECIEATGKEFCEGCHYCEDCWYDMEAHCPECGECYEDVARCEKDGDHCENECVFCPECDECAIAEGGDLCDYCGLCEDCCGANSKFFGMTGVCVENPQFEEKLGTKHDADGKHVLEYASDETGHWQKCKVKGCDYTTEKEAHHSYGVEIFHNSTPTNVGQKGEICTDCKAKYNVTEIPKAKLEFAESPKSGKVMNGQDYKFSFKVTREDGTQYKGLYFCAVEVEPGKLPVSSYDAIDDAVESFVSNTIHYSKKYENKTLRLRILGYNGNGYYLYSDEFTVTWEDTKYHKHEYSMTYGTEHHPYYETESKYGWHWYECACGAYHSVTSHNWKVISNTMTCTSLGETKKICTTCGMTVTEKNTGKPHGHTSDGKWLVKGSRHYQKCKYCGKEMGGAFHEWEVVGETVVCTDKTIVMQCKVCQTKLLSEMEADVPNHVYNANWIHGHDDKNHWEFCVKCTYKHVEPHNFVTDAINGYDYCSKCMYVKQGGPYITMSNYHPCPHKSTEVLFSTIPADEQQQVKNNSNVNFTFYCYGGSGKEILMDTGSVYMPTLQQVQSWEFSQTIYVELYVGYPHNTTYKATVYVDPLTLVKEVPATCKKEGVKEHYVCVCGKFVDKNGNALGDISIPKLSEHTYDDDCDETCNVCLEPREAPHAFKTEFSYNAEKHYHECGLCGLTKDDEIHAAVATLTKSGNCYEDAQFKLSCSVCGMDEIVDVPASTHEVIKMNLKSTCVTHGYKEHGICKLCGTAFEDESGMKKVSIKSLELPLDPTNHAGGKYRYDDTNHWILCACGEKLDTEPHKIGEKGGCGICGYKKYDNPKRPGPKEEKKPMNVFTTWWFWVLLALILLLIAAGTVITILIVKKNRKNKEK